MLAEARLAGAMATHLSIWALPMRAGRKPLARSAITGSQPRMRTRLLDASPSALAEGSAPRAPPLSSLSILSRAASCPDMAAAGSTLQHKSTTTRADAPRWGGRVAIVPIAIWRWGGEERKFSDQIGGSLVHLNLFGVHFVRRPSLIR